MSSRVSGSLSSSLGPGHPPPQPMVGHFAYFVYMSRDTYPVSLIDQHLHTTAPSLIWTVISPHSGAENTVCTS